MIPGEIEVESLEGGNVTPLTEEIPRDVLLRAELDELLREAGFLAVRGQNLEAELSSLRARFQQIIPQISKLEKELGLIQ